MNVKPPLGGARVGHITHDALASFVVFLVALPLCMGVAIASGMPPAAGLISGIVGGLVVGALAGSPLQVSGPAAGLSVMVYEIVQNHGPSVLGIAVLIAGAVQVLAGALRLGQWFRAVSPAVIRGMLTGIGILILSSQFHVMVDDAPRGKGWENLLSLPEALAKGIATSDDATHHWAALSGLLTIGILITWKLAQYGPLRTVPAPLVAVAVVTTIVAIAGLPVRFVQIPDSLWSAAALPSASGLALLLDKETILAGLALAFVASAETLLCAVAVDKLHTGPRTRYDQELLAQGVGNSVCGLLGALPVTGVIVRSAANVDAGARTRASAILHGLWLLLFAAGLPFILRMIPTSALAGILVFTGFKLIDKRALRELGYYGWSEVAVFFATIIAIVAVDLLTGVLLGVGLSMLKLLYRFSHLTVRFEDDPATNTTWLHLNGAATFVRLPQLAQALERVPDGRELHVHFEHLDYVDHACLELLQTWGDQHAVAGGAVRIDWESLHARYHAPPRAMLAQNRASSQAAIVLRHQANELQGTTAVHPVG